MGDRVFAAAAFTPRLNHCHLFAVKAGTTDRSRNGPERRYWMAPNNREINPLNRMVGKLAGKPFMCDVRFGDDQQPGSVLVDPMDDPGPGDPADPR